MLAVIVRDDLGRNEAAEMLPALVENTGAREGHRQERLDRLGVDERHGRLRRVAVEIRVREFDVLVAVRVGDGGRWRTRRDVGSD